MSRPTKVKSSVEDKVFSIINYTVIGLFAVVCIFPLFYVLAYSLTPYEDYLLEPLRLIPKNVTFLAYKQIFNFPLIRTGFTSTILITVVGTLLNLFLLCISAYPLSKKHLKGRNAIMMMIMFTMFFNGGMIPNYILIGNLNLLDSYWSLILPGAISAYNLILMRNFISSIPDSLEEAAIIDGANELTILAKVIIPLSKPAIATFLLFHAVGHWNAYFNSILYITDRKKWPLMLIVREMVVDSGTSMIQQGVSAGTEALAQPFTLKMAIIIVTILPIICVYPFVQKYFMKGMLLGSVKG